MSESDAFFTQSIVGAPFSIVLGRRQAVPEMRALGIDVPLDGAPARLGRLWREQVLLTAPAGSALPRQQPSWARRWLERHALAIAAAGLLAMTASGGWTAFIAWRCT